MRRDLTRAAVSRLVLATVAGGLFAALGACTTVEGTNAMTDFGTFEREVMISTLQGTGMIEKEQKDPLSSRRAPLALPKGQSVVEAPGTVSAAEAALPADGPVQLDTSGLSEDDIKRMRRARVVDVRSLSGRPLSQSEQRQLQAQMDAARGKRVDNSLYLPPDEYFTTVKGQDFVCLAADGRLVTLNDNACPQAIRKALGSG